MISDHQRLLDEKYAGIATPAYEADKKRLALGEPLAYVIGHQPFIGLTIYLESHPLIPRPETEWWTEQLLAEVENRMKKVWPSEAKGPEDFLKAVHDFRFLDLCAGSGAIGCAALKTLPYMEVFFSEIDPAHEPTIQKNIRENHLDESRATIGIGDLFEPFGHMTFDIIAANPPYVPEGRELPKSVAHYEPALALLAGPDGLGVIRRIAEELPKRLSPGGVAWIECDREHAEAARALFAEQGFNAEIRTDQYGKPRVILVSFP
jgi:release factor glutamine methyltransferase